MSKTILFADDEQWVLNGISEGLKALGYNVIPATDGSQVLDLLSKQKVDLLLLDVMMPPGEDMDPEKTAYGRLTGLEVCKTVRQQKPKLPIICLTVVMERQVLRELRDLDTIVIEKPALPSQIARRIAEVIGEPNART